MKKIFLLLSFLSLSLLFLLPLVSKNLALAEEKKGGGLVGECATSPTGCSSLTDLTKIPCEIVKFLRNEIAVPASAIFLTIGGLLILFSAGDPHLFGLGKRILIITVIGMFLVFGADAIVKMIYGKEGCGGSFPLPEGIV